ncbi:MAG: SRPBCC domain-containing protein [Chloroflexota bacterium]
MTAQVTVEAGVVQETSYTLPSGRRVLRHEVIVPAARPQVWTAFSTSEGLRSFAAPVVELELRLGGRWEASYNPQAKIGDPGNIINEVICYLPLEMLSIRIARTPPGFPHPEVACNLWTVIQFQDEGPGQTRVITSMLGWQDTPADGEVHRLFQRGNAQVSQWLYNLFTVGPRQWQE